MITRTTHVDGAEKVDNFPIEVPWLLVDMANGCGFPTDRLLALTLVFDLSMWTQFKFLFHNHIMDIDKIASAINKKIEKIERILARGD